MNADASIASQTLLDEIDAQQDEVLSQLDALSARIESVLQECVLRAVSLKLTGEPS
jgi:hypothetical protein